MTPSLSEPGGVRPVVARWTIIGELILETATHLGGGAGDIADMVLICDARTGGPLLPGTSIAGALRSHLGDVLGGYRSQEDERVALLFGGARGSDLGAQSPLIVFDSLGALPDHHASEIRNGVQLDAARGIAEEHKKFDLEVLPPGTSFPMRFDLVVSCADEEPDLLALLVAALSGFSGGDIALGARRSRGLGAARATRWKATRYELSSREGWLAWLLTDGNAPSAERELDDVREACLRAFGSCALPEVRDRRRRLLVDVDVKATGGLLVRSAPGFPDAPDAAHIRSAGRSVLPGTSLAGVLRKQALRIARVVRGEKGDGEHWIDRLFGPRMEGIADAGDRELRASKLRITEGVVEGARARGRLGFASTGSPRASCQERCSMRSLITAGGYAYGSSCENPRLGSLASLSSF
ncbi:MAG: RAMP superfamily CRISPR-associated protein [Thermoleophilia bacterium]|nr:RAMP superfamily CRISPR-associated protein [Thermoleophilia bacterium]